MSEAVVVTYEEAMAYPLGTVVEDAEGYWSRSGRRYVKTGDLTWAVFFSSEPWSGHQRAIEDQRNNLSPCPFGYVAHVTFPDIPASSNTYSSGPESDTSPGPVNGPNTSSSTSKGDDRD